MTNPKLGSYANLVDELLAGNAVEVPMSPDFVPSSLRSAFSRGQLVHAANMRALGIAYKNRRLIFNTSSEGYQITAVLHKPGRFAFVAKTSGATDND